MHPNPEQAVERLNKMGLEGVKFSRIDDTKMGITGTGMVIDIGGEVEISEDIALGQGAAVHSHDHDHHHSHDHGHAHHHHDHDHGHSHDAIMTITITTMTTVTATITIMTITITTIIMNTPTVAAWAISEH